MADILCRSQLGETFIRTKNKSSWLAVECKDGNVYGVPQCNFSLTRLILQMSIEKMHWEDRKQWFFLHLHHVNSYEKKARFSFLLILPEIVPLELLSNMSSTKQTSKTSIQEETRKLLSDFLRNNGVESYRTTFTLTNVLITCLTRLVLATAHQTLISLNMYLKAFFLYIGWVWSKAIKPPCWSNSLTHPIWLRVIFPQAQGSHQGRNEGAAENPGRIFLGARGGSQ